MHCPKCRATLYDIDYDSGQCLMCGYILPRYSYNETGDEVSSELTLCVYCKGYTTDIEDHISECTALISIDQLSSDITPVEQAAIMYRFNALYNSVLHEERYPITQDEAMRVVNYLSGLTSHI